MVGKRPIDPDELASLVAEGLTAKQIAERIDRSVPVTRRWLRRHGLRTARAARRDLPSSLDRTEGHCSLHGEVVLVRRSDGGWKCRRCRSEAVARRRQEVKRLLVAEAGGACAACGYDSYIGALHFHHVDPEAKSFGLANNGRTRALATLREEAAKCVVLCSNCHAEVEGGVRPVPDAGRAGSSRMPVGRTPR